MTALSTLEREALRDILRNPDLVQTDNAVVLVAPISKATLRAPETFEAENEDMEEGGDMEPSILSPDDLENDIEGRGSVVRI
jgi:hypothetical protein